MNAPWETEAAPWEVPQAATATVDEPAPWETPAILRGQLVPFQQVNLHATTQGPPPVTLPDANVVFQNTVSDLGEGIGDVFTHPGVQLPSLAPSMETFQSLTRDPFTSPEAVPPIPLPPTTPEKVALGAVQGADELTRGITEFLTSGSGIVQAGLAATPLAPAVAAKWAKDMVEGGLISTQEAYDAYKRGDTQEFAKQVALGAGQLYGAKQVAGHGLRSAAETLAEPLDTARRWAGQKRYDANKKADFVENLPGQGRPIDIEAEVAPWEARQLPETTSVPQTPESPQASPRVAPAVTPAPPVAAGISPRADAMSELTGVQNEAATKAQPASPVVQQVSDIKAMLANLEATLKANQGAALLQPNAPTPSGATDVESETQKSTKRAETPVPPEAGAASISDNPEKWRLKTLEFENQPASSPVGTIGDIQVYKTQSADLSKLTAVHGGKVVADLVFGKHTTIPDSLEGAIEVAPEYRRKGIATALYNLAETATGKTFSPSLPHTKAASLFWKNRLSRIEQPAGLVESQGSPSGTPTAAVQPESASPITTAQPVAQPQGRDVQPVGDNLPEPVHKASANFDKLVRDYGPQAGWSTGDEAIYNAQLTAGSNLSHGIKAKVEASKQMQAMRRAALSHAVPAAERDNYDLTTPQGRAAALPRLESWIKQRFPGDNSIDQRRALEQFARNETPAPTTAEQRARTKQDQQALRRVIAQNAGITELQGLVVHIPTRGASGQAGGVGADQRGARYISAAEIQALRELDRQQGTHTILVDSPGDEIPFNGFKDPRSNVILIHARTKLPLIKVAGHEVWHHIRQTHHGLYADTFDALFKLIPPEQKEKFKKRLAQRGQPTDDRTAYDELMGDYFGDNMGDPNFWQRLAKEAPELFKRLARIVKAWLDKLIAKLKGKKVEGYESEQHFSDLTKARDVVANALVQAARETQYRKAGLPASDGGLNDVGDLETFSKPPGEDLFGAPESVEEQRQRIKNEELKIKNAKANAAMQERAGARLTGSDLDTTKEMFGGEVRQDKSGQGSLFSKPEREAGPLWRSNIQDALESWPDKITELNTPEQTIPARRIETRPGEFKDIPARTIPGKRISVADQVQTYLQKTTGAMDEAEWIGLDDFLKDKPSVTKQQVQEFVKANTVEVREVVKGAGQKVTWIGTQLQPSGRDTTGWTAKYIDDGYDSWFDVYDAAGNLVEEHVAPGVMTEDRAIAQAAMESRPVQVTSDVPTEFSHLQHPGGEDYRELLLTLPGIGKKLSVDLQQASDGKWYAFQNGKKQFGGWDTKEQAEASSGVRSFDNAREQFRSSHFPAVPNPVLHLRFNKRTDADGKKVLFIEEVQSDWHQTGRKEGYQTKTVAPKNEVYFVRNHHSGELEADFSTRSEAQQFIDEHPNQPFVIDEGLSRSPKIEGVPNAPFKQTWPMLAMKRMIRYASEHGFDRIAWTTGEQQAERYDLSKQIGSVHYNEATQSLTAYKPAGSEGAYNGGQAFQAIVPPEKIADYIGKDPAEKLLAATPQANGVKRISGLDLKVGGEGMKGFYDKILPGEVNKFVKKWGGRVSKTRLTDSKAIYANDSLAQGTALGVHPVHSIDITPAMRDAAMQGMPMFSKPERDELIPPNQTKPFQKKLIRRAVENVLRGTSVPAAFVDARQQGLSDQKYIEETMRLNVDDLRARINAEFKTTADRGAANKRLLAFLNGEADVSTVGGPAVQLKAVELRSGIDDLSGLAVSMGLVRGDMAQTWLGNRGEWLKRTYLAFDSTADWNYDTLKRRKEKGDTEIARIWNGVERYLKEQNPKMTAGQIEAEMRSIINRQEVEDALGISAMQIGGTGRRISVDTSSLLKRKDLAPEVRAWMGEIKDPYAKVLQSSKWLAQFMARNMTQRRFARIGLDMGLLSNEKTGIFTEELYEPRHLFVPEKDAQGNIRKSDSGDAIGSFRTQMDRKHEPLSGYFTTPEFKAALSEFDDRMNNTIAGLDFGTVLGKAVLTGTTIQKGSLVGLNPYSYGVNALGGLVMRLATGAINPVHYVRAWNTVRAGSKPIVDTNATQKALQARADYLLATQAGLTGKGILLGDVQANLRREVGTQATRRAIKAVRDILADKKAGGAYVRLRQALGDMWRKPGEIGIRFLDDVYRVSAFFDELALAQKAFPEKTHEQRVQWAADRASNIYQTYDRLPKVLRDASRVGVLNTFVSFKAELFRNAYWIARYAKEGIGSDNPHLKRDGAQKAAGLMAMVLAPFALAMLSKLNSGVDDDKDKALKRWIVPPWDQSDELAYVGHSGMKYEYVPMGYLLPTFELTRPFTSIWQAGSDPNPDEAVKRMMNGWMSDYFGPGAFWGPLLEAGMNKRLGNDRPLTLAEGTKGAKDRLGYVAENFTPRAARISVEAYRAATGQSGDYGRSYSLGEISAKLSGLRQRTVDVEKAAPYVLRGLAARWRNASTYQNTEERKAGDVKARAEDATEYEQEKKQDLKRLYIQAIKDLQLLGVSREKLTTIETESRIPNELK